MNYAPVAHSIRPAVLPVFDPAWSRPCLSCRFMRATTGAAGERILKCSHPTIPDSEARANRNSCSLVRMDIGACGPGAKLREAK